MGVTRTELAFEGKFTQVPNEWARDKRLSRKARGLLVEIMSHRVGWHVTVASLQLTGPEGRDAIKSALVELKDLGYLVVSQGRGDHGRFSEVEYELQDPATGGGFSVSGGLAADGSPADGSTASGKSAPYKNTIPLEDHLSEDQPQETAIELIAATSFEDFWEVWPKKVAKPDAKRAWDKATLSVPGERIVSAAIAYRDNPGIPERQFIPYPATWLNRAGWDDELPAPRGGQSTVDRGRTADQILAAREQQQPLAVSA